MSTSDFSIIIPTYGRPVQIKRTVDALLPQLDDSVRLIVIDNASPVPVSELLSEPRYQGKVQILRQRYNIGGNANIATCFYICETEWMWLLGDDDHPMPDAVATIRKKIEAARENTVFISFSVDYWVNNETDSETDDYECILRRCIDDGRFASNCLYISTSLFRAKRYQSKLEYGFHYAGTSAPHLVMTLLLLKEGSSVMWAADKIITPGGDGGHGNLYTIFSGLCSMMDVPALRSPLLPAAIDSLADNFVVHSFATPPGYSPADLDKVGSEALKRWVLLRDQRNLFAAREVDFRKQIAEATRRESQNEQREADARNRETRLSHLLEQAQSLSQVQSKNLAAKDESLRSQADELARCRSEIGEHLGTIAGLNDAVRIGADALSRRGAEAHRDGNEIVRLRRMIYGASAGRHLYRAWRVFIGDRKYHEFGYPLKKYHNLHVPWHTHLYRAGLGLFLKGEKPWHNHLYRAWRNLSGDPRYSAGRMPEGVRRNPAGAPGGRSFRPLIDTGKKKILQFTTYSIENPDHGGKMRCHSIREALRARFDVRTLSVEPAPANGSDGFAFGVESAALYAKVGDGAFSDWGAAVMLLETPALWEDLKAKVAGYAPDAILLEQPFLWPVVSRLMDEHVVGGDCQLINSSHNNEVVLKRDIYSKLMKPEAYRDQLAFVGEIEREATRRAALSIAVSETDCEYLESMEPRGPVLLYRNGHAGIGDTTRREHWRAEFRESARNYVFVGSWHMPNIVGLKRLVDAGLLGENPQKMKLWVFGGAGPGLCATHSIELGESSVLRCPGRMSADDIDSAIMESDGVILPIWDGGGSNLKTAQGLLSGRPIIASAFAFRGMEEHKDAPGVVVVDTPEEIIAAMRQGGAGSDYARPDAVARLRWDNLLKPMVGDVAQIMGEDFAPVDIGGRLFYDLTTLVRWKGHPSGIARVVANLGQSMARLCPDMRFVVLSRPDRRFRRYDVPTGETGGFEDIGSGDLLFSAGANWDDEGFEDAVEELRSRGGRYAVLFHDAIPFVLPHSFGPGFADIFLAWLERTLRLSDMIFANSINSKKDVVRFAESRALTISPVTVIRFGDALSSKIDYGAPSALRVTGRYILTVGTLEFRKNHIVLLNAYRMLLRRGGIDLPELIIIGRKGWMDSDVAYQLEHDEVLRGKIRILGDVTDAELDSLYRNCMFTVYPALYEGWGLPISESLGYGKLCVTSRSSSMVEIAPELTPFADPLRPEEWAAHIGLLAGDPALLAEKTAAVVSGYRPTDWRESAATVLSSIQVETVAKEGHLA